MPKRIQLSRKRGWRMPENTVKVDRSTKWGNPFHAKTSAPAVSPPEKAVDKFRRWLAGEKVGVAMKLAAECFPDPTELRGKNLACWCPLDQPCHADVLLQLANSPIEKMEA
jgi:hypothetical protein